LKRVLIKIGVDRSIFLTVTNRIILAFGSLLTIYFISRFLTKAEQGYYYTFGSLAALQVFFELGLSIVITQFVAHEFAFLTINANQEVEGSHKHIARLSSLLHFMMKWYIVGAAILFILVLPVGFVFFYNFQHGHEIVSWQFPWIVLVFFTALNLLVSSYVPYLEGLNKIRDVAQFRVMQGLLGLLILCVCLRLHFGLYSLGIVAGVNFFTLLIWIATNKFKKLFVHLWKQLSPFVSISWKKEILPFQWKIGVSWLSGYFIFQLFNPLIFAFEGPVVAGQLGITLAAFNGISVIAMAWINTKIPTFSMHIAKKNYEELDNLFF
jgi:O-antigen/teichoic acid export membrane protein